MFYNLYDIIVKEQNIMLAYRNIKSNKGSETAGVNHRTIKDWKNTSQDNYVEYVRKRLSNYFPHKVKRVEIPKPNGNVSNKSLS
jgi:retron-type reverse transcriptase